MEGEVEGPPRLGTEVVDEEEALLAAMNEAARISEARATAEVSADPLTRAKDTPVHAACAGGTDPRTGRLMLPRSSQPWRFN